MVPDDVAEGQGEDREGRHAARPRAADTDVQLPRVQRCASAPRWAAPTDISTGRDGADALSGCARADTKVVYRRYASLFFVAGISQGDNELVVLEVIHRFVEVLDRYFGNVSCLSASHAELLIDMHLRFASLTCTRRVESLLSLPLV